MKPFVSDLNTLFSDMIVKPDVGYVIPRCASFPQETVSTPHGLVFGIVFSMIKLVSIFDATNFAALTLILQTDKTIPVGSCLSERMIHGRTIERSF